MGSRTIEEILRHPAQKQLIRVKMNHAGMLWDHYKFSTWDKRLAPPQDGKGKQAATFIIKRHTDNDYG
jgi:hypothetical protein